ncbi:MAG: OmpA family protein [Bacteroidota bacterium]
MALLATFTLGQAASNSRSSFIMLLLLALSWPALAQAQPVELEADLIHLRNPSFEDRPRAGIPPIGWDNCGFHTETPPDVHPDPLRQFQVNMGPQDGNTYLGMVVRDNETWESVGQELNTNMVADQCYDFRIFLARSRFYVSQSRVTNQTENYTQPIMLRVYGSFGNCDKIELIGKTDLVKNHGWREYKLKLKPTKDYTHIIFEAYYETPVLFPYNGNILLDNASPLVPINCEEELPIDPPPAENPVEPPITEVPPPTPPTARGGEPPTDPTPEPAQDIVRLGETEAVLEEGTVFRIEKITFEANSDVLQNLSEDALQEIVGFLRANPNAIVEIGGHASSLASTEFANEISLKRARSVVRYLRDRGIATRRLFANGYGKERRVCMERTSECQRRNQRVEVKIIRLE